MTLDINSDQFIAFEDALQTFAASLDCDSDEDSSICLEILLSKAERIGFSDGSVDSFRSIGENLLALMGK